jgi:plasmid maintenance system antidote protein VapI
MPFILLFLVSQHHTTKGRAVVSNTQIAIPVEVRPDEVARKQSLGQAIELCAELAGFNLDKTARSEFKERGLEVDKAQFSRWKDGTEGILWPKLEKLMDACGNDAPLLWMNYQRGFDLYAMRKRQTETERALEAERQARQAAEEKLKFLTQVMQGKVAA